MSRAFRSIAGACWVEITTVSSRTGSFSAYSIVTCVFPSGLMYGISPLCRTSASFRDSLCASMIGSGISSGVSRLA